MTKVRCQRRRKMMARGANGGCGTEEKHCPIYNSRVPNKFSPESRPVVIDFYAQACKALAVLSPFDLEDAQKKSSTSISTLPGGLASCLSKHSDSRKRHKKSHLGPETKKNTSSLRQEKPRARSIWSETQDYFRELTVDDINKLTEISAFRDTNFISITNPYRGSDISNTGSHNAGLVATDEVDGDDDDVDHFMDVDCVTANEISHEREKEKAGSLPQFCSGVEWLLGSRNKIYLTSERPSKKRKHLGGEAGLEKLFVALPVKQQGPSLCCHYCSLGDLGNQLNRLVVCSSCGVAVHQRCYGVQQYDDAGCWLCSWCRLKRDVSRGTDSHCILCPQPGGALKPVRKRGAGNNDGDLIEFAHLFCCQWMPEVYIEDTKSMEPILNIEGIKDTQKKLVCYLCKVKCGACVRCSNGACRTSFHPVCAREAKHRMEIWGKFGCDDVELRAFCSKHSEGQRDCNQQVEDLSVPVHSDITEHHSLPSIVNEQHKMKVGRRNEDKVALHKDTIDIEINKLGNNVASEDGSVDARSNFLQIESVEGMEPKNSSIVERGSTEDVKVSNSFNFTLLLKKLVDREKVNLEDVASEIGVYPDLLASNLAGDCLPPDLHCKVVQWLKNHAHIGALQKSLKFKVKSTCMLKAEKASSVGNAIITSANNVGNHPPVKLVPPQRRTKGNIRMLKDNNLILSFKRSPGDDEIARDEDKNSKEKASVESQQASDVLSGDAKCSSPSASGNGQADEAVVPECDAMVKFNSVTYDYSAAMNDSRHDTIRGEALTGSYVHPLILNKFYLMQNQVLPESKAHEDDGSGKVEASSSSGICCNHQGQRLVSSETSCDVIGEMGKIERMNIFDMSPIDEVEGELVYYQHKLLCNAVSRKHFSDGLIYKVVKRLTQEIDITRKQNWDAVLVNQYLSELRELKKQGRKERRHKEAQAVLAAATAAAAASSRLSSFRKDTVDESAHRENILKIKAFGGRSAVYAKQMPRAQEIPPKSDVAWTLPEKKFDSVPSSNGCEELSRVCDICRRTETLLNPIFVCSSCKVAVHIDCYRSVKDSTGPWYCELCEDLSSSRSRGVPAPTYSEKPCHVAECSLCGGTAGAFRKSADSQWVHVFCAEWVLESTFRRGQVKPVEGMETISRGTEFCVICNRKQGVCIKCNYGHCQSIFHPICGRSAGFFMNVRNSGGKIQHKAYCEKHSLVERTKAETQKHGVEEWNSLKKVRVELERLRLICERIIRREKLKRELVVCSHDILGWNKDTICSSSSTRALLSPDVSSESATTSLRGYVNSYKSCSETIQRSDDITVDSTVASKRRRIRFPIATAMDNDQKTDDSSTSHIFTQIPPPPMAMARASFAGKQIPRRPSSAAASRTTSDDGEKCSRHRKHTETFEKELVMTSDQASMRNERLPKGFVYVPIRCLSNDDEETVAVASSEENTQHDDDDG